MTHPVTNLPIVVIIATSNKRTKLSLPLALISVYKQKHINPVSIYIVDDNIVSGDCKRSSEFSTIKQCVSELRSTFLKTKYLNERNSSQTESMPFDNYFKTTVLKNLRTKGFSGTGAWNTAALEALREHGEDCYLAFLDDDDEWKENYLYCHSQSVSLSNPHKTVVAAISGIQRIERDKKNIEISATPNSFNKEEFFIGNPGLQGSNLFVLLDCYLKIGGFDESLKSCTDRDFAIRLITYLENRKDKIVNFINQTLCIHDARSSQRVSTTLKNKHAGLTVFYQKYLHLFNQKQQQQSLLRAKKLFQYDLPTQKQLSTLNQCYQSPINIKGSRPYHLYLGVIVGDVSNLKAMLSSFLKLYLKDGKILKSHCIAILDNSLQTSEINDVINFFKLKHQLNIQLLKINKTHQSIAVNRTVLQNKIYQFATKTHCEFITWIIDDDSLFECNSDEGVIFPSYFSIIGENQNSGIDAMFGQVSGTPPLPFLSTIRTQLLDCSAGLSHLLTENEKSHLLFNNASLLNAKDFFHDLSTETFQHLEQPYHLPINITNKHEALKALLKRIQKLLNGGHTFRAVQFKAKEIGIIGKESIYRGGNTIIFNPDLLKTPNYTTGDNNRRGDFNWALINKYCFQYSLHETVMPITHNRITKKLSLESEFKKFKADISGAFFYRLLKDILTIKNFDDNNINSLILKFQFNKEQRITQIKSNLIRIKSLLEDVLSALSSFNKHSKISNSDEDIKNLLHQSIVLARFYRQQIHNKKNTIMTDIDKSIKPINKELVTKIIIDMKKINHAIKPLQLPATNRAQVKPNCDLTYCL